MCEVKASTSLAELKGNAAQQAGAAQPPVPLSENVAPLGSAMGNAMMMKQAKWLADSQFVPDTFRGRFEDCFQVVELAKRLNIAPMLLSQQLYIVHGRPAMSAKMMIGMFNKNPAFSPLRYEFKGTEGKDDWGCRAWAVEKATGEKLHGTWITIGIAKDEGWYSKPGSKWKTMPEQMLRYRAAVWFINAYAPEQWMGLPTDDEAEDIAASQAASKVTATVTTAEIAQATTPPPSAEKPKRGKKDAPQAAAAEQSPETPAPETPPEATVEGEVVDAEPTADNEPPITPATLKAVQVELKRLGGPVDCLPPDESVAFQTSDPAELSEADGQRCLERLKVYKN